VWGAIEQAWKTRGGLGALGLAATDETGNGSVSSQTFQAGQVVWSAPTGAHSLWGDIRSTWDKRGGWQGPLGLPVTEEVGVAGGSDQSFQGGAVVWTPSAGSLVVWGAIGSRYLQEGGAAGTLGLPLGNEQGTPAGASQAFEHGHIVWDAASGTTRVGP
jgi:uncharacterized protein with LGFP repeats